MHTSLISAAELAAHLSDRSWLVIDCRFDLANPNAGETAYAASHIPGALYAHLDRDLSAPITASTGRHPLPSPEKFAATLSSWGVTPQTQVVVYDADVGMYASRLWWMLRWVGHEAVAVLDGGFRAWTAADRPTSTAVSRREPATFHPRPNRDAWADADEVAKRANDPAWRVLDARATERFNGSVEPLDAVAGHIPGARNHPFMTNIFEGKLASRDTLRQRFDASQASVGDDHTIVMCGSGVTACHLLLALEVIGKRGARLYPGSWSEWIRDPSRPVAKDSG